MSDRVGGGGTSLKEKIGRRGFRLETETAEGHEWHENMRVCPAIASLQTASFCFGTLLALLMVYVGSRRA